MVTTSGFSGTPVTRLLILCSVGSSILVSTLDIKYLLPIKLTPHIWPYLQFTRLLTFQTAYLSASEVLFSSALLYQFRVLERLWGSKKYASFLVVVWWVNLLLVPFVAVVLKVISLGTWDYIPPGLTGLAFAALSAWGEEVPLLYRYKVHTGTGAADTSRTAQDAGGSGSTVNADDGPGVILSDKSTVYLLATQMALSQFPYQIVPAAVGWIVGSAWMGEMLPGGLDRWRIPAWLVGETSRAKERGQFEGLRRRLEEEGSAADGMRNVSDQQLRAQDNSSGRGLGRQIMGYFTGS